MATIDGVLRVRASSTDIGSPRAAKAWHSPQRRSPGSVIIGEMVRIFGGGDETAKLARRPEALAASLGVRPKEGLEWLGRAPDGRLGLLARLLLGAGGLLVFRLGRIRLTVEGREHLPQSGYLVAAALHRGWIDPLVVIRALPAEPRPWFIGSGPSTFDRRWKETLLRRVGGILPVWRGGVSVDEHVAATRAVVDAGCPYVIFIEGGTAGPPDRLHRVRSGVGLAALRLDGMPIVPFALAGSDDLYRGKRIGARIGPPITAAELLGDAMPARPPEPGSREELRLARLVTERLAERIEAAVAEMYPGTVDPPEAARPWRWLRRLF